MSNPKTQARKAVELARQALLRGDRTLAQQWAKQAVDLAPDWEDPWLVLAASSDLLAAQSFLEKAYRINPNSIRVRKGFEWLERQLAYPQNNQSITETLPSTSVGRQNSQPEVSDAQQFETSRSIKRKRPLHIPWLIGALLLIVFGISAWSASSSPAFAAMIGISHTQVPINYARADIVKPTYTASPTATLIPSPTPTLTPLPTSTAVPTSTPVVNTDVYLPTEPVYTGSKYILVDISEQHLYAYEGDVLVYSFVASTGMNNATRTGHFSVLNKIPNAYGATWNIWMPHWLGIYWSGTLQNGIHALPIMSNGARLWSGYLGTPISYGCVVLGVQEAEQLYYWADIGTPVEIQW